MIAVTAALFCCLVTGCTKDANGEYRNFADTAKAKPDKELAVITPGPTVEATVDAAGTPTEPEAKPEVQDPVSTPADTPPDVADGDIPQPELMEETGTRDEIVSAPKEIKLLVAAKDFVRDNETKALRVTYDDIDLLKILNMEPVPTDAVDHFPGWLKQLNGKRIRIRGFMYPTYSATGLTGFLLARDNGICCFVRKAKIYDLFVVKLAEGETTDYIEGLPFDVVGTFHIDPLVEDDELLHLYRIDEARVIRK